MNPCKADKPVRKGSLRDFPLPADHDNLYTRRTGIVASVTQADSV